jgi:hypothetical protein
MGVSTGRGVVVIRVRLGAAWCGWVRQGRQVRQVVGALGVLLAFCVSAVWAQDFGFRRRFAPPITAEKTPYDGRFTFARLRHGSESGREPPWAHDYPRAERNFTHILKELTLIDPNTESSNVFMQDDPGLFTSPILYVSEPGFWTMTDDERLALQTYVQKGGFIIFDDFRGARDWGNLQARMADVMPDLRWVTLDASHPVFHSFFDINQLVTEGYYGPAEFRGLFEDNDPAKRLVAVANVNHDLGEFWEFSDTGWVPVDLSNEAYKYGVNYVIYGMTH